MCGICAYIAFLLPKTRREIMCTLLKGLKRQEYRGYDSAGLAIDDDCLVDGTAGTRLIKTSGKVDDLERLAMAQTDLDYEKVFEHHIGIAHTRWATHGPPCPMNSHPQSSDPTNEFVCVHNGIISNHRALKEFLESKNYHQRSETDTEIIVLLLKYFNDKNKQKPENERWDLAGVLDQAIRLLEGAFSIVVKSRLFPGQCVASRKSSPLIIGMKIHSVPDNNMPEPVVVYPMYEALDSSSVPKHFHPDAINTVKNCPVEYFFASDASAIIEHTNQVIYLEENDIAVVKDGYLSIHRREALNQKMDYATKVEFQTLKMELQQIMKGNYSCFMEKEIFEQTETVFNTMRGRVNFDSCQIELGGIRPYLKALKQANRIILIACGTSYYSALAVRQLIEELSKIPVTVELASDFLDRKPLIYRGDACVFISQSGETADTLGALRYCRSNDALMIGITNVVGSSISRETTCGVHVNAGPEIGVASTKAYTSQITCLVMLACKLGSDSFEHQEKIRTILSQMKNIPTLIKQVLSNNAQIKEVAQRISSHHEMVILGRGTNYATCLEGALKIKEITYMHSEGIAAGELKHGPLALIDSKMLMIVIVTEGAVVSKSINALKQVVARGVKPIIITDCVGNIVASEVSDIICIPPTVECLQPILAVLPFQLIALHMAQARSLDVDFPRNLAKSVTVE